MQILFKSKRTIKEYLLAILVNNNKSGLNALVTGYSICVWTKLVFKIKLTFKILSGVSATVCKNWDNWCEKLFLCKNYLIVLQLF